MTFGSDSLRGDWNFTVERRKGFLGGRNGVSKGQEVCLGWDNPREKEEGRRCLGRSLQGVLRYLSPDLIVLGVNIPLEEARVTGRGQGMWCRVAPRTAEGSYWRLFSCGVSRAILSFGRKPYYHKEGLEGDHVSG